MTAANSLKRNTFERSPIGVPELGCCDDVTAAAATGTATAVWVWSRSHWKVHALAAWIEQIGYAVRRADGKTARGLAGQIVVVTARELALGTPPELARARRIVVVVDRDGDCEAVRRAAVNDGRNSDIVVIENGPGVDARIRLALGPDPSQPGSRELRVDRAADGESSGDPEPRPESGGVRDPRLPRPIMTDREREVLTTYVLGATTAQAAAKHFVSINTVGSHYRNVANRYRDVGRPVANKSQMLLRMVADGLIELE